MARWQEAEPRVRQVDTLDDLLAVFEDRQLHDERDELLLALIRLAASDLDAHRTVVHILRAGLIGLAGRAAPWWGWEDASSAVIGAAVYRIQSYPSRRTARVAANLLGDVWHCVWAQRKRELRRLAGVTDPLTLDDAVSIEAECEPSQSEELLALVAEAVRLRRISAGDGRLVALHRVAGYSNVEVSRMEGKQPCTVRKRRLAAEAAIAALAVA
jgi:hypothetical protein